jgi:FtsP/CotA-like multicopper oxidase with cupredoxin domain
VVDSVPSCHALDAVPYLHLQGLRFLVPEYVAGKKHAETSTDFRGKYNLRGLLINVDFPGVDGRPPSRSIELHFSGNMERFIWGFDAYKFYQAEPIYLKLGERLRFVLINDTMMEHPIHLHGLWSEQESGHGELRPINTPSSSSRVSA